jgi:hypothetical protein
MLLRPKFWRGLQHGDRPDLPTHTRHMRPRCYPISTGKYMLQRLALFMTDFLGRPREYRAKTKKPNAFRKYLPSEVRNSS